MLGGFTVEGLDLYTVVRRHGCWPWQTGEAREASRSAYLVAELIRLLIGAVLAGAAAKSGQVNTAVAALAVGIAAPLIVDRLSRVVPLSYAEPTQTHAVPGTPLEPATTIPSVNSQASASLLPATSSQSSSPTSQPVEDTTPTDTAGR